MKIKQITVLAITTLFAVVAFAGDKAHHKMEIKVVADDGDGETQIVLDSDDMGFNMHDMQVGENQSIVDKSGRPVLITRTEKGFTLEVDGKTVEMPVFDGPHDQATWVGDIEVAPEADIDVIVMREGGTGAHGKGMRHRMAPRAMMHADGVMIISGEDIDEATQEVIRNALLAAGHESVHFAGGHDDGPHEVRVVTKIVEVSD